MIRWRVLALMVAGSFIAYLLRINLSIASTAMTHDLGLSEVAFGTVLAAFAWGYGLFQVPGGFVGERFGARRTMTWLYASWTVLTVLTALVPKGAAALLLLIAIRFLIGVVHAPVFPVGCGKVIASWYPPKDWALPNGLSTAGLTLGAAAAGPGIAWLVGATGWRTAFLVIAPLGLVMAALWWRDVRDDPADHPAMTSAELAVIRADRVAESGGVDRKDWIAVLKNPAVLGLTFSYFCSNYIFYLFFNWFYYYLVEIRRLPEQAGGNFTGAQWVVGAMAAVLGGWISDRLTRRWGGIGGPRAVAVTGLLLTGPLLIAGAIATDPTLAVILLSLSFGAVQLTDGPFWAAVMFVGGRYATASTGLMNTGGNVVGGVGALLVPLVAQGFGWTVAMATGAVFGILGVLPWLWLRDRTTGPSGVPQTM